jgi:hypothetical protein
MNIENGNLNVGFWKDKGFKSVYLKLSSTKAFDPILNKYYFVFSPVEVDIAFYEWSKEGRINQNKGSSCFDSSSSVNYVMILQKSIPHLRPYVTENQFNVDFSSSEVLKDGSFRAISSEEKLDGLKIMSKDCSRKINGINEMVISEIYEVNK